MKRAFRVIIAGGKTGGHLFPGIAIAQALLRIKPDASILFVGTGASFEIQTLSRYGFAHERIFSAGIKGKGILEKIKAALQIPVSIIQSVNIIIKFRPDIVVGVGGFSSGPVVLGARLCGVTTAIQEQNSIAGITNRILARFADVIFTSFKDTRGLEQSTKTIHTGNTIRKNETDHLIVHNFQSSHSCGDASYIPENRPSIVTAKELKKKFTILVTGGSQGAKSINTAFIEALELMKYRGGYQIIHQTGAADEKRVLEIYKKIAAQTKTEDSLEVHASAFFNDLPRIQAMADLIICRAGAGTISEITAIGKASLLVPYPFAADDHQTFNAKSLADRGAAWMISDKNLSGEFLKEKIEFAHSHPDELSQIATRAKELGNPFADETIASICIQMAKEPH
ncbi:MAG: undecaprenyldiphospho-muramoylpentapeptide beta-N-acetylglucosaminyltransferase [Desulfamplus sp.]|nr:undecaprenyldiphospho-muramoylpentapeptide beta-N-acetylglucosaminyltransferase [Desulfamplus sp.]